MKPYRSRAHLAFVRSRPCCVCGRRSGVETAHVGIRGLGQKCDDRQAIPLCRVHHREQHRIGLKRFVKTYNLDIPKIIAELTKRPVLRIEQGNYVAYLSGEVYRAGPVSIGLKKAVQRSIDFFLEERRTVV